MRARISNAPPHRMSIDLSNTPLLIAEHVFLMLSELHSTIWKAEFKGAHVHIHEPRRIVLGNCAALARASKHWNHAWREFVMTHVVDHLAAIVRGSQLRYFINCLNKSMRATDEMNHVSADDIIDLGCQYARRAGDLCRLPSMDAADAWLTERRCIAESLRDGIIGSHGLRVGAGEDEFYAKSSLITDTSVVSHTKHTLDSCVKGYPFFFNVGIFLSTIEPFAIGDMQTPIDEKYNLELGLAAVVPVKTHFDALRDAFPEVLGANALRNRSLTLSYTTMLRMIRAGLSDLRDAPGGAREQALCLPAQLYAPDLLRCNISECMAAADKTNALHAALRATHGTRAATRRTMTFILFKKLAHRMLYAIPRAKSIAIERPGLGSSAFSAKAIQALETISWHVRWMHNTFGIKLSDTGVISAADVVLHTFDANFYRQPRDWLQSEASVLSLGAQRQLRRLLNQLQAALVDNCNWCEHATHHQRLRELYVAEKNAYELPIDKVFGVEHTGIVSLWNYMGERCRANNASQLKFIIENSSEKMLPPLIIEQHRGSLRISATEERGGHVVRRRIVSNKERIQSALRQQELSRSNDDDDGDENVLLDELWHAEYWISTRSDPYDRQRSAKHSVNEYGKQNQTKLVAGICFNQLGDVGSAPQRNEFVVFWQDGAYDYDRPMQYGPSDKSDVALRSKRYYRTLVLDSANAIRMLDARAMFQPLVMRFTRMLDNLAAVNEREQRHAIIASMCHMRGHCALCQAIVTSAGALARGTCERCTRKRKLEVARPDEEKKIRIK